MGDSLGPVKDGRGCCEEDACGRGGQSGLCVLQRERPAVGNGGKSAFPSHNSWQQVAKQKLSPNSGIVHGIDDSSNSAPAQGVRALDVLTDPHCNRANVLFCYLPVANGEGSESSGGIFVNLG